MQIRRPLARLAGDLLDLFYPRWCVVCERPLEPAAPICAHCLARLVTLPHPVCPRCRFFVGGEEAACPVDRSHGVPPFPVWALGLFDDYYRRLIHAFKFENRRDCGDFLGERLGAQVARDPRACAIEAVVPVPLHRARRRERGFNQSELLAAAVAAAIGRPVLPDLVRVRNTKSQTALDGRRRQENVAGAFTLRGARPPKVVLLVDDVVTTGATIRECAVALAEAGAGRIFGAVVALAEQGEPGFRRPAASAGA
jgi:ComF family protein